MPPPPFALPPPINPPPPEELPLDPLPEEAGEPTVNGIFNKNVNAKESKLKQAKATTRETQLLKPVGITRPPKERFVK